MPDSTVPNCHDRAATNRANSQTPPASTRAGKLRSSVMDASPHGHATRFDVDGPAPDPVDGMSRVSVPRLQTERPLFLAKSSLLFPCPCRSLLAAIVKL
jgi:hypothetical protein